MSHRAIQLRPIKRQDASRLAVLLGQLGYPADVAAVNERLDYFLDDPLSYLIGADNRDHLVGVAALHVCPLLEVTGRLGRLLALVLDDRCQGQGVGRSLVVAVEELGTRGWLCPDGGHEQPQPRSRARVLPAAGI